VDIWAIWCIVRLVEGVHVEDRPIIIPAGTGLIEAKQCRGIQYGESTGPRFVEPLSEPVDVQLATFANGVRRVCCLYARDHLETGEYKCHAFTDEKKRAKCKYAWKDPASSSR
jgi:hypothetical protein